MNEDTLLAVLYTIKWCMMVHFPCFYANIIRKLKVDVSQKNLELGHVNRDTCHVNRDTYQYFGGSKYDNNITYICVTDFCL